MPATSILIVNTGRFAMTTKVAKWGNSLAVRIPAKLAEEARLACGDKSRFGSLTAQSSFPLAAVSQLWKRCLPRSRPGKPMAKWIGASRLATKSGDANSLDPGQGRDEVEPLLEAVRRLLE